MNAAGGQRRPGDLRHKITLVLLAAGVCGLAGWMISIGGEYYRLPAPERPFHPLHENLRPSGSIGRRLGLLSAALFLAIYLYPLRKRFEWLRRIGQTRRWLDVHIALGLLVPLIVTIHAAFKLNGLIGMAYWIMLAIVASGIVGRYLYAQIPRSITAAELSLKELQEQAEVVAAELRRQTVLPDADLAAVLSLPDRQAVDSMPLPRALWAMIALDLARFWRIARLRRRMLAPAERLWTLGGLRKSRHAEIEAALANLRAGAWLGAKVLFLRRAGEIFHLWHVVHKPFSYSFALIVAAHIALMMLMGYF